MENIKLRLWARMICGDDYDEPPNVPAFNLEKKRPRRENVSDALAGAATAICKALSPASTVSDSCSSQNISTFSPTKTVTLRMNT